MTKNSITNNRIKQGFTLMELVLVLAIISVLLMVAIPSVFQIQRLLKSAEMETAARQLYIAAQNRLTVMKSAGTLRTINPLHEPSLIDAGNLSWISSEHMPADYDNSENTWSDEAICYATNKNSDGTPAAGKMITDILVPVGAVDSAAGLGYYLIEYNPSEGAVYGVFYAEEFFSYEAVRDTDRLNASLRNIEGQPIVGYYGGVGIHTPNIEELEAAASAFLIENGETLFIRIDALTGRNYTVTIEDKQNPSEYATYTYTFRGNQNEFNEYKNVFTEEITGDTIILLDSLQPEKHFSDFFSTSSLFTGPPAIIPGRDIRISLSAEDIGTSGGTMPSVSVQTTNSLFASRIDNEVAISSGRHLQNLEPSLSGVSGITSAIVQAEINWDKAETTFFKPISNRELKSFKGGGNLLHNFTITVNTKYCGLFGEFGGSEDSRATLCGIRLSDVTLHGSAADYIGALAGIASHTDISNCSTFVLNPPNPAKGKLTASSAQSAGGLVGSSSNNTYNFCFASLNEIRVNVTGASTSSAVGGFIGSSALDEINHCYANTTELFVTTSRTYAYAGGFAGRADSNSMARYSYALGNINQSGGTAATGFWYAFSGSADSCYTLSTFEGTQNLSLYSYGFSNRTCVNCSYFSGAKPTHTNAISGITERDIDGLSARYKGEYWRSPTTASTHPYASTLSGKAYPVSFVPTLAHYGNWPIITTNTLVPIGGTNILGPNVEIPKGQIMVFKDDQYVFLKPNDLLQPLVITDKVLLGGSLYVPKSAGELSLGSQDTINWDVQGHIIVETDIEIDNNNVTVTMLSRNGNIIMNNVDLTDGKKEPYLVSIIAENGNIEANEVEIESKSHGSGKINLVAKGDVNIKEAEFESDGDEGVNVQSKAGSINAQEATIKANGGSSSALVNIQAAGSINLDQADVSSKVEINIHGVKDVSARSADISNSQHGQNISITSSEALIILSSLPDEDQTKIASNGNIYITAKKSIYAQSVYVTTSNHGHNISINSEESGIDLSSLPKSDAKKTEVSSKEGSVYIVTQKDISIISAKIAASPKNWGMELRFTARGPDKSTLWVKGATVEGKSIIAENFKIEGKLDGGNIWVQ